MVLYFAVPGAEMGKEVVFKPERDANGNIIVDTVNRRIKYTDEASHTTRFEEYVEEDQK